jgi:hypothetical protein
MYGDQWSATRVLLRSRNGMLKCWKSGKLGACRGGAYRGIRVSACGEPLGGALTDSAPVDPFKTLIGVRLRRSVPRYESEPNQPVRTSTTARYGAAPGILVF